MSLLATYNQFLQEAFSGTSPHPEIESSSNEDDCLVSRGDSFLDEGSDQPLKSELPGVSDEAWGKFVKGMVTADLATVSPSNELGMFRMKPRRLSDLGLVSNLTRTRAPSGRMVWAATFAPPMTSNKFLRSPQVQYHVFASSMRDYAKKLNSTEITKPVGMSTSGALAVLHKAGPSGLKTWEKGDKFPETVALHDKIKGIF